MASWNPELFGTMPFLSNPGGVRPVLVNHFVKITYTLNNTSSTKVLARVSWFKQHPAKDHFGQPAEVWCDNMFETFGVHSYIPISSLVTQCVHCILKVSGENVLVVVPLLC